MPLAADPFEKAVDRSAYALTPDRLIGEFQLPGSDHRGEFDVGRVPIVFLPVRLETRFFGDDLKVRIYPDQIHLNSHQVRLTRREVKLGQTYWKQRAELGADVARDTLVQHAPPRRAAWIAKQTAPVGKDDAGPVFKRLKTRRGSPPAVAELLPERFAIAGFVDNERRFVVFTGPVTQPLPFAPDLSAATPLDDDPMAWMLDFDKATASGMAATVSMAGFDYGLSGLTLLVAGIGVQRRPPTDLEHLFTAHHHTHGLSVQLQGTPTNNTDEAIAGWSADVQDIEGLFERTVDGVGTADSEASAAGTLIDALGLRDDSIITAAENAGRDEAAAMAAMNRALWPVTWGRYLDDLLAPEVGESIVAQAKRDAIREFFVDHVRGGAALPVLSIGAQPYGVLPIMRRDGGDLHSADPLVALEAIVLELRERWRDSLPGVARLDPVDGGTSDTVAAEILGTVAHPLRFIVRRLTWQWGLRTGIWQGLWDAVSAVGSPYAGLGYAKFRTFSSVTSIDEAIEWLQDLRSDPTLAAVADADVDAAVVILDSFISQCEAHRNRQTPLNDWYPDAINGVLDESVTTDPKIFFAGYGDATADEIFNHSLVHSEHATAAHYLSQLERRLGGRGIEIDRPGGIDLDPWGPAGLRRTARNRSIAAARQEVITLPQPIIPLPQGFFSSEPLLYQLLDAAVEGLDTAQKADYALALDVLAHRSEEELELRLRESLGLASYRLDAWLTAFASRELTDFRAQGRRGIKIGGFGWVEGLRPTADGTRESNGFIHAPSVTQAVTAAVLRAGYHAHTSDDPYSLFAVDLRSGPVRTAAWLLDGLRQGQTLGELLGCRFERQLHDSGLDPAIDDCRRRVLEVRGITMQPRGPVDGLELAALYENDGVRIALPGTAPFVLKPHVRETQPARRELQGALDGILGALDAVADASIADSVHDVLHGNLSRASATLDAVATGAVPPPELKSLDTHTGGVTVSHRVLVALPVDPDSGDFWQASPRSNLEPALETWAARLLGDPASIRCVVTVDDGIAVDVTLADLSGDGMSALDAVYEGLSGWKARAAAFVLAQPEHSPFETALAIDVAPATLAANAISFADAQVLAASLRTLLGTARTMTARDLALPGVDEDEGVDLVHAGLRLETFRMGMTAALERLAKMLPEPTEDDPRPMSDVDLDILRSRVGELAAYGVGTVPARGYSESGRRALFDATWAAHDTAATRLRNASTLPGDAALDDRVRAVVGKGFPVLAPFTPATEGAAVLKQTKRLLPGGTAPCLAWLKDMARVRLDVDALDGVLTLHEALFDAAPAAPIIGQLPWVDDEPWVALALPKVRNQDKLALFAIDGGGAAAMMNAQAATGLIVDAWTERIPAPDAVTGVAVHHDAPTARPPQTLLLALPPSGQEWSFDNVVDTLLDTLEAAKLRAVDPDNLLAYGHQAPAIVPRTNIRSGTQEAEP